MRHNLTHADQDVRKQVIGIELGPAASNAQVCGPLILWNSLRFCVKLRPEQIPHPVLSDRELRGNH